MRLCEQMKTLTKKFQTKHNTAPFSQIKIEDYKPAFIENIAMARAEIDAITNNPKNPNKLLCHLEKYSIPNNFYKGDYLDKYK